MSWLLEGNDFGECRRTQCPKVLPCTMDGCGRPLLGDMEAEVLRLYQDCKERKSLPEQGGVMDQSADLMRLFRALDETLAEFRKNQEERERREYEGREWRKHRR